MKETPSLYLGVDIGASAAKAVILDAFRQLRGTAVVPSGMDFRLAGENAVKLALSEAGIAMGNIKRAVSTGYGRRNVAFAEFTRTEISCHALGAHHFFPDAITVVDIGGQDNKIIQLAEDGRRLGFVMNRRCAAGTGAFLEEIARRIGIHLSEMEQLARRSRVDVEIGSFCTVFSLTEILGMIRDGVAIPDIVKAAFRSVVKRLTEMAPLTGRIVATGGVVAHNPIMVELLAETAGITVQPPPNPQFAGAIGAAIFAIKGPTDAQH